MARHRSSAVAERFGANLRRVCRREGLSQEGLAVRASLHRTEVGVLERGSRASRIDTLIRLASAMAVPPGASTAMCGPRRRKPRVWTSARTSAVTATSPINVRRASTTRIRPRSMVIASRRCSLAMRTH
jgi:transcriptional regulator with XRE-family HTH domain